MCHWQTFTGADRIEQLPYCKKKRRREGEGKIMRNQGEVCEKGYAAWDEGHERGKGSACNLYCGGERRKRGGAEPINLVGIKKNGLCRRCRRPPRRKHEVRDFGKGIVKRKKRCHRVRKKEERKMHGSMSRIVEPTTAHKSGGKWSTEDVQQSNISVRIRNEGPVSRDVVMYETGGIEVCHIASLAKMGDEEDEGIFAPRDHYLKPLAIATGHQSNMR